MDNPSRPTVQNCANFNPTKAMFRWFDAVFRLHTLSPSRISEATGIHRNTYYYWLTVPEFKEWMHLQLELWKDSIMVDLINIGAEQARKGNYKFWRSLMEFFGLLPPIK